MSELTEKEQQAVDALREHGSQRKAAEALGIHRTTLKEALVRAARKGAFLSEPAAMTGFEISQVSSKEGDKWVKQRPEGSDAETLPPGHIIKGISSLVDESGKVRQQWVKTRLDNVVPDLVAALKEAFKDTVPLRLLDNDAPRLVMNELLTVYPIADQHVGLLSWGKETGEPYDLKIGGERLRKCARQLVDQSQPSKTAIVLNLGDWQHTDDQKNMTPGHQNILDVDSRYFKILQAGVQLMIDIIALALQKHETVIVRNIPGNHDPHASVALTVALGAYYRDNPRVQVEMDPSDFFFYRFGQTLLGATHGHKMKPEKMAMTMAVLRREDWGATKYHHFMFGHIHHETSKEVGDCRVESFQSLTGKDAFAHSHGYLAGQSLQAVTYHTDDGEIGRHRVNVFNYRK